VKSSGKQGDISFMSIIEEFKRMKTSEFWKQVKYWSVIKWPPPKKFSEPIARDEWLPIIVSALIGVILVIVSIFILRLITGK
jgi:sensor c-di-GMP phosphodiesterase-like protein